MLKDRNGFQAIDVIISLRKLSDIKRMILSPESIIDSFQMQLTVFENGTCTLSCARSTEDHFICERYKDQIIPSKRKSINVMAQRFSTKE